MFDSLRDLTRSPEVKRQEALSAYLDDALSPAERRRVEAELAQDAELRAQMAEMRAWQQQLRTLPNRSVPRNFVLDPASYSLPRREPLGRAYPALRVATAMAAIMFVIALGALLGGVSTTTMPAAPAAMEVAQSGAEAQTVVEELQMDTAVEESAAEAAPAAALIAPAEGAEIPLAEPLSQSPGEEFPLDEAMAADSVVEGGGELATAKVPEDAPLAQAADETMAMEAEPESARSVEEAQPPAPAEQQTSEEVQARQQANLLLLATAVLGLLLMGLFFLTLLARRQS